MLDCSASSVSFMGYTGSPECCYENGCNSNKENNYNCLTSLNNTSTTNNTPLSKNSSSKTDIRLVLFFFSAIMALILKKK